MGNFSNAFFKGGVTFISKPIAGHSWSLIRHNDRSYIFYDPQAVTSRVNRLFYFKGTRAGLLEAIRSGKASLHSKGESTCQKSVAEMVKERYISEPTDTGRHPYQ